MIICWIPNRVTGTCRAGRGNVGGAGLAGAGAIIAGLPALQAIAPSSGGGSKTIIERNVAVRQQIAEPR
jgi:hypothetical protein